MGNGSKRVLGNFRNQGDLYQINFSLPNESGLAWKNQADGERQATLTAKSTLADR
jgi:hypothetical protein